MMRKIFTFIAVLFAACMMAEEFEVNGIYYSTLTSNTVQVVKPTSGKYTGDIVIPATVYDGQTYHVVAIGDYAFQGANQVTSVTLPLLGITSIGGWAFNDCTGLTSFMLPASITSIGERAFYFCDNLHDLYVCATDPASYNPGNMAFSKIHYGSHVCTLHVPTGCTAAYAADPTFSVFTQVEEFDPPVLYDIYIAGTRVTEYNASDILEDGTVSYNAETKTLTLNGASIVASGETDMEDTGIYIGEEDVIIEVIGESTIDATYEGIYLTKDANIIGSELLTIDSDEGAAILMKNNNLNIFDANLVLSSLYGSGISGSGAEGLTIMNSTITATADPDYSAPALGGGWQDVQLIDCYIELPEDGKYDPEKGVVDKNDVPAQDASIKPGVAPVYYDIYVKGIHVSDQNASDIFGDGTVSYSAGTKTLTLNGANIYAHGATDMENTGIYVGEEDVIIEVIGESTIDAAYEGIYLTKDANIIGSELLTIDSGEGSAILMKNNNLNIFDANLVLSSLYGSGISGSGAEGLTIMNSTITATADPYYSAPALGGGWQDVQLIDCYIELPEGGKYDPEKGVVDKNDVPAQDASIKPGVAPVLYDIYIAGTRVTEDNASDILEDGTVSYNAETKTLTLDEAYIGASGVTNMEKTGIYIGEEDVTILVAGSSYIDASLYGIHFTKDATITGSAQLTFDAHSEICIRMFNNSLTIDGANLVLSGQYGGLDGYGEELASGANTLTIKSSTITASAVNPINHRSALDGIWQDVQLIDCYIELPEEGRYDWYDGVVDKNDDIAYNVSIKPSSYTITWKNDDGSVIDQTVVEYGQTPTHADPSKPATAEFTYTFAGWTPAIVAVTGDATYTATYNSTRNSYTITWKNDDGSTIDQTVVEYGQTPTHADPSKPATAEFTYNFAGWTPAVVAVAGDATYTATYNETVNQYTITATAENGTVQGTGTYDYGTVVELTAVANDGYKFDKWSDDVTDNPRMVTVTENMAFTALFVLNGTTGIEDIHATEPAEKVLMDGILYIVMPDGKIVNVLGQPVR